MLTQTEDYMDAFETVYPGMQMVVQFDWSSRHAARRAPVIASA
jgi:hypothetical protein